MTYDQYTNGLTDYAKLVKRINHFRKNIFLSIESKMRI